MADRDVAQHLWQLLGRQCSLDDFQDWFAPQAWSVGGPLTRRVTLRLAEFTNGHWTEEELLVRLHEALGDYGITPAPSSNVVAARVARARHPSSVGTFQVITEGSTDDRTAVAS